MGSIEDNLKKAWEAMTGKKKTPSEKPSLENLKTGEKQKVSEDKNKKEESKEEKIAIIPEKKENNWESLEENVQETSSSLSKQSEDFFSNRPSQNDDSQSQRNGRMVEEEESITQSYAKKAGLRMTETQDSDYQTSNPRPQEDPSYSPTPNLGPKRTEINPIHEKRAFDREFRQVKPIGPERIIPMKSGEIIQPHEPDRTLREIDRPYESRHDPLQKKYKILK